jgi:hypothetical protein
MRVAERAAAFDHEHHYSVKLYSSLEAGVETVRAAAAPWGIAGARVLALQGRWRPPPDSGGSLPIGARFVTSPRLVCAIIALAPPPALMWGCGIHSQRPLIASPPHSHLTRSQAQSAVSAVKDRVSAASDSVREGVHSARDGISSAAETAGAALSGPLHAASERVSTVAGACRVAFGSRFAVALNAAKRRRCRLASALAIHGARGVIQQAR